jgi:hypothetical protein
LRSLLLPLAAICLGGCQYTGPATGPGTVTISTPFFIPPAPPGVPGLPPPGVGSAPTPRPPDGEYAGVAKTLTNFGGNCRNTVRITYWLVKDGEVSYRGYSGTIARDGGLKMQLGNSYIIGTYRGSHFEGRYWRPLPGCTYVLSVDPV